MNHLTDAEYNLFRDRSSSVWNGVQLDLYAGVSLEKAIFAKTLLILLNAAVWNPTNDTKPTLEIGWFRETPNSSSGI